MKRQRPQHLRSEVARLQSDIETGTVHICRGGKAMMRKRLHLDEANLDEAAWRAERQAKRGSFGANGEAGKRFGNETVRVFPDGTVEVDLPKPLGHLANVSARGVARYRLGAKALFSYRAEEWRAQVGADRAVAYDVVFGANARAYLDRRRGGNLRSPPWSVVGRVAGAVRAPSTSSSPAGGGPAIVTPLRGGNAANIDGCVRLNR